MRHADTPRIALQVTRDVVVATIQVDLNDDVLARFQVDLLERVQKASARGVILDVSGLDVLDSEEFAALRRVMVMASLMGADSVLVGLQPGIAAALIEAGADTDGLQAARDLDAALDLFEPEEALPDEEPADEDAADPNGATAERPGGDEV